MDYTPFSANEELVLLTMMKGSRYGLEIQEMISEVSEGQIEINIGSLYPMLKKFENQGLLMSVKVESEDSFKKRNKHRRKYYALTNEARQMLFEANRQRQALYNNWNTEVWLNSS